MSSSHISNNGNKQKWAFGPFLFIKAVKKTGFKGCFT